MRCGREGGVFIVPRAGAKAVVSRNTRVIYPHSPSPSRRRGSCVGPSCSVDDDAEAGLGSRPSGGVEKCRWRDSEKWKTRAKIDRDGDWDARAANRARHLLGTAGIDESRTVVSPRLWGIASWPARARRALRLQVKTAGATSRAAHRTRPTRTVLSRHAHVRPSSRRHARVRRARGRAARRAPRVRQPVPARSVQAVSQEPPPAGGCGRTPRVLRRLHGPRDEPHVQALLQGASASTERAVGRSAPRATAPARARARRKNIPSRCLSTRPPTSGRTNHERKRRARRSRTAREANAAPRDVRDARLAAVLRARAHRRSRTRDPRARSPRTPPCVFTVSSAPYPSQTATSRTHPASAPPVNNGRPRRFFFHAASQRRRLASRDADASDPPFPLARRS